MSIGIRPSRIYVPETWSDLLPAQQDSLLRHEVAHIQRWDGLYHILQVIAQAIYFFHPLVWLLNSRINDYREMVCDDIAVERSHISPLLYSRCLVHVAENMLPMWSTSSASALIKQRNKLYHRVNYQVKESTMKFLSKPKAWFVWAVLFLLFIPLSWYCKSEQSAALAQKDKAKLSGIIKEHATEKPLQGVVLSIDSFGQSVTDENGYYAFDRIPSENFILKADYNGRVFDTPLGFDELPESISKLAKLGMTVDMHLNLKEPTQPPEIVVEATRPPDGPSSITGSVGKITGQVIDAKSGEPLPGANVVLVGTKMGAATDMQGHYFIIHVPPGVYQLDCSFMGYASVLFNDVKVTVNKTTTQDFKLTSAMIRGDKISISAEETDETTPRIMKPTPEVNELYRKAFRALEDEDFQKAIDYYDQALTLQPQNLLILRAKQWAYEQLLRKIGVTSKNTDERIFFPYDEPPEPIGGWAAVQQHLVYPELARKAGVEGIVKVAVLIDAQGNIAETKVEQSLGNNGCDEAAVAAIKKATWKPAKQRSKPVSVWVTLPVEFKLK